MGHMEVGRGECGMCSKWFASCLLWSCDCQQFSCQCYWEIALLIYLSVHNALGTKLCPETMYHHKFRLVVFANLVSKIKAWLQMPNSYLAFILFLDSVFQFPFGVWWQLQQHLPVFSIVLTSLEDALTQLYVRITLKHDIVLVSEIPLGPFHQGEVQEVKGVRYQGMVDDLGNNLAPNSQCDSAYYRKPRIMLNQFIVVPVSLLRPPKVSFTTENMFHVYSLICWILTSNQVTSWGRISSGRINNRIHTSARGSLPMLVL
ncbi:hypothetical protein ARMGADRAFT_1101170 [Armillaria gallica]|uniref:Uncharacterized protein n=1 Tax=Armillaria gallica TaxID=47427 RepID=A0A2H3CMJ7_ARMGA|nr:hypothetical protein ARMGADRAFT_1101170 [Armillaria gallica]